MFIKGRHQLIKFESCPAKIDIISYGLNLLAPLVNMALVTTEEELKDQCLNSLKTGCPATNVVGLCTVVLQLISWIPKHSGDIDLSHENL